MRAWLLEDFTGLDALRIAHDHPTPVPGAGQSLLKVQLAALNPADRYLAERLYPAKPKLPHILGRDAVGHLVNQDSTTPMVLLRGDAGVTEPGTLAEYVTVPSRLLVPLPHGWTPEQGAGAPLVYLTAWQCLTMWGTPQRGDVVVITGASGGVGVASIHLARHFGLRIVALSRGTGKAQALRDQGADLVLEPGDPALVSKVKEFAGKAGAKLVVDSIGGAGFEPLLDMLGRNGAISVVGRLAGPVPSFNTSKLFFKRLRIGGVSVGDYTVDEVVSIWQQIVAALDGLGCHPLVDSVYEFNELRAAFDRLAEGPLGKVLIRI